MGGVEAEACGTGPPDLRCFPGFGDEMTGPGLHQRVFVTCDILVADLTAALVLEPNLPHEIAGEARDAAAALDIGVDGVPHLPRPVFVVADKRNRGIAVDEFWRVVKIGLADDVERVAFGLGPG